MPFRRLGWRKSHGRLVYTTLRPRPVLCNGGYRHGAGLGSLLAGPPVSLSDWELWACANSILMSYGEKAPVHVAEQIGMLALKGDAAGIRTWQAIASRIEQLQPSAAPAQRN